MSGQPQRTLADGEIDCRIDGDGRVVLSCVTDGEKTFVKMGGYNAWRTVGVLALMLGIKLPAKLGKSIRM